MLQTLSNLEKDNQQEPSGSENATTLNKEFGSSGTAIWKGFLGGDDYNYEFNGQLAYKIYDEMRRSDPTVKASLKLLTMPIIGAEWGIEPASDDPKDEMIASFVHHNLFERNSFNRIITNFCSSQTFGFYVAEKVHTKGKWMGAEDGKGAGEYLMLDKLATRRQDTIYTWQMENGKAGVQQMTLDGKMANIPANKLVIYTHEREGDNYQGISPLRSAYKNWYMKTNMEKISAIGAERQAVGVPYFKAPADAKPAEKEAAREAARNLRANQFAYMEVPVGWEIGFMDMGASSTMDLSPLVSYHDRRILLNVLGQYLDNGSTGSAGSRATSEDQSRILTQSLEAIAAAIAETIQESVIKQLVNMNFTVTEYPKLTYGRLDDENVEVLSSAIKDLMDAGALTADEELEEYTRKTLKLPAMSDAAKAKLAAPKEEPIKTDKKKPVNKPNKIEEDDSTEVEKVLDASKKAKEVLLRALS